MFTFAPGARGVIDGTWYFSSNSSNNINTGATFLVPKDTVGSNHPRVDVNGTIIFKNFKNSPAGEEQSLFFNNGSVFRLDGNGGHTPRAVWNANSTIYFSGNTNTAPSISIGEVSAVGNLIYDGSNLTSDLELNLINHLNIKGNFEILNTNGRSVTISTNGSGFITNIDYFVNGNFNINGAETNVILANSSSPDKLVNFQVNGDFNMNGNTFQMQFNPLVLSTKLTVNGNLNIHTTD
jgi:hypothetical protein